MFLLHYFSHRAGSKRKVSSTADDEEDGIVDEKRPRRDRLKKTNEKRTVFVGNVPLTTNKKVSFCSVCVCVFLSLGI